MYVVEKNLHFKNCFNFKDISSYKNWFQNINSTEPMIIKPTRDQPSRPTPVRTPTTQIGTPALPLWSLVFCFVFPFRSFMFLLRTQSSVLCVHTQCRSVSSIYLRVDGLAHGNTGTLQCVLLHTKVRALVEWHRDHEVTQHQSEIIQKMHTGSQGQLKARKWKSILSITTNNMSKGQNASL